jgi:hypothetical protein
MLPREHKRHVIKLIIILVSLAIINTSSKGIHDMLADDYINS